MTSKSEMKRIAAMKGESYPFGEKETKPCGTCHHACDCRERQFTDTVIDLKAKLKLAEEALELERAANIKLVKAIDAIYNDNKAARAAVVKHYGTCHSPTLAELRKA